jgi:hypothetical protein
VTKRNLAAETSDNIPRLRHSCIEQDQNKDVRKETVACKTRDKRYARKTGYSKYPD